jgi:flagellar protein FlaG
MNTDLVQSLMVTATKPASPEKTSSSKQETPTPGPKEAVSPPKEAQIVPATQKVQETVAAVAAQIESYLKSVGRQVQFSIDSRSGETIISVRDAATGELIRQIPSAEALRLSQSLGISYGKLVDISA